MDKLEDFILRTAGERWRMGFSDCGPWLLRWATEATGKSVPMITYANDREALRHIVKAGNFVKLVGRFCRDLGLSQSETAERGDIGVICLPEALSGQTAAICLGDHWVIRVRRNGKAVNLITDVQPIMCWRVE